MRPLRLVVVSSLALGLLGCVGGDEDGGDSGVTATARCVADLTLALPDGTSTTLDYCQAYSMEVTFEFDPDEAPAIRSPRLVFHSVTDTGFECWVEITEPAAEAE